MLTLRCVMLIKRKKCRNAILPIIFLLFYAWTMAVTNGCNWNKDNIPIADISTGKLTLSWDEVPNVNFYNIYFSTVPGVTKHRSKKIKNTANPITIVDLELNETYYFAVTTVDDFGESEISEEVSYRLADTEGFIKIENLISLKNLKIFFDPNSTSLSDNEIEKLNRFSQFILRISTYHVRLDAYSDSAGDGAHNKVISINRANIVKSYLVSRGVKAEDIDTMGHGAKNFIADNDTPEGRKVNRRVEIKYQILK